MAKIKQVKSNQEWWDKVAQSHQNKSVVYDLESFRQKQSTLHKIELEEMGDVTNKKLLHLQCHLGLDTISWEWEGAKATGIDISGEALKVARELAVETGTKSVDFIESDVHELHSLDMKSSFDIVYTSYGILPWINNLNDWAEQISLLLNDKGFFYIVDFHPVSYMFDVGADYIPILQRNYFHTNQPNVFKNENDYADPSFKTGKTIYTWDWSLSDLITALIKAGLTIEHFNEFNYSPEKNYQFMKRREDGMWYLPELENKIPLLFSVKASK